MGNSRKINGWVCGDCVRNVGSGANGWVLMGRAKSVSCWSARRPHSEEQRVCERGGDLARKVMSYATKTLDFFITILPSSLIIYLRFNDIR